jgi:hypothetical protein
MDKGFFEGVAPEVDYLGTKTGREDSSTSREGQRSQNRVRSLLRAIGQRLLPQLPSQSAIAGEPGLQEDSRQRSAEVVRMSYSSPIGLGGMYSAVSRRDVSIW